MVKEKLLGLIKTNIKETGKIMNFQEWAFIDGLMEQNIKDNGKII